MTQPPATSFDAMTLGSPSPTVTTPAQPFFPNSSTLSLNSGKSATPNVIKEGYVRCKEDKFLAGWNRRYLILREFRLDFMKDENGKLVQSIPLNTVLGVSRSEEVHSAFEINRVMSGKESVSKAASSRDLPQRTITCEVRNDDEIYDWIDKIYERCPSMGGVSNPTNFSQFNTTSSGASYAKLIDFNSVETGKVCYNVDISSLNIAVAKNGTNATLLVAYDGGDGTLFQVRRSGAAVDSLE